MLRPASMARLPAVATPLALVSLPESPVLPLAVTALRLRLAPVPLLGLCRAVLRLSSRGGLGSFRLGGHRRGFVAPRLGLRRRHRGRLLGRHRGFLPARTAAARAWTPGFGCVIPVGRRVV